MTIVTTTLLGILLLAAALCLRRLAVGTSLPDRIVALDTLLVIIVAGLAIYTVRTGNGIYLDALLVASLLGFTGTSLVARFIERRGAR